MVDGLVAFLTVLVVLGTFAWVGFRARGPASGLDDYFVARGSQRAGVLGLSFLASGMGVWILFAPPEVGAFVGVVGVVGYALGAAAPIAGFALLGRRMRRVVPHGHSLVQFLRARYGPAFTGYAAVVTIAYMLIFVTAELTAIGAVAALVSGLDARVVIFAVAGVTAAYTAYGGLRASLRTDRWQAWLLLGLLAVTGCAMVVAVSDPVSAAAGSGLIELRWGGIEVALTLILAVTAANLFHQGYWQRVWAATDDRALARGAAIGVVTTVPVVLVVGMLGIVAAGSGLDLGSPPVPLFALVPGGPWLGVVVIALAVALVASSVDTLQNGLASLVASQRPRMSTSMARVVTVALMVPAAAVAVQGFSVLRLFLIADLLCAAVVVPALAGLWSRVTSQSALAGGVAGLVGAVAPGWITTGSLWQGAVLATFPGAVPTLPPFAGAIVSSTLVCLVVTAASSRRADLAEVAARVDVLTSRD